MDIVYVGIQESEIYKDAVTMLRISPFSGPPRQAGFLGAATTSNLEALLVRSAGLQGGGSVWNR